MYHKHQLDIFCDIVTDDIYTTIPKHRDDIMGWSLAGGLVASEVNLDMDQSLNPNY